MLFADVRGSTTLAEQMSAGEFSRLMNRFYRQATDVLIRTDAFIDKLVGDEVMALYFPLFTGPDHAGAAIRAARELLEISSSKRGSELPVGVGVHTGIAYVGTVSGAEGTVTDITALGDNVNITARLASAAGRGEALISEATLAATSIDVDYSEERHLMLKGKSEAVCVRVLQNTTD
jgi:adenylate cyclase